MAMKTNKKMPTEIKAPVPGVTGSTVFERGIRDVI
jgi:hypothetical protein